MVCSDRLVMRDRENVYIFLEHAVQSSGDRDLLQGRERRIRPQEYLAKSSCSGLTTCR
jgi:hypothetical protein